jgi:hypothetical protein
MSEDKVEASEQEVVVEAEAPKPKAKRSSKKKVAVEQVAERVADVKKPPAPDLNDVIVVG